MSDLKLFLFGSPRLEWDGAPLPLKRRKAVALLTYLAMTGEVHNREALAALFWPDYDASRGRAYLRRDLAEINTLLGEGWLMADREQIGLDRSAILWVDVARFQQLLATCQAHDHPVNEVCPDCLSLLAEAVELYHGDFLAGFTLPDAANFDEWQFFQTESLRQALAEALEKLVRGYCAQEEFKQAVPYARHWVSLDPLHGPAQQQLMQVYAWAGQQAAALRQYDEYARILDEEIGALPDEEIIALYEAIKAKQLPPLPQAGEQGSRGVEELERYDTEVSLASLPSCPPVPPHNLPAQTTPFIGREEELTDVQRLILNGSECRLLTLIGPGGIGKTRLAIQAAWQVVTESIEAFLYGIYFIPLTPVSAAEFLVQTIAEALHFSFYTGSSPKTQLLNYLRKKEVLLILDDFEHLLNDVGATSLLSEILASAPKIKLLVTSRERLNLQEEWVIEIDGLPFPEIDTAEFLETQQVQSPVIESYGALQLFVQSARRASVGFSLSAENVSCVVRICQLVGGMPLGIELASAWVRMLPCREIAQEIERNLDFLTTSVRNIPERHQSLRAVFEHSWKLLTPVERHLFRRLSVFRSGFRREAAEVVADASLVLLSALIDKSLLHRNTAGRYEMHHLLGQYAAEKLEEVIDEKVQVQAQHAHYYATFLRQRENDLRGGRQQESLAEIGAEIENVRLSWRWTLAEAGNEAGRIEVLEDALEGLFHFYDMRSWFEEGEEAFSQAASIFGKATGKREQIVLGKLLARQGWFAFHLGQHEQGRRLLQQSLDLLQSLGARAEMVFPLNYLGAVTRHLGESDQAKQYLQESLAICKEMGDRYGLTIALNILGQVAYLEGEYAEARRLSQECLAIKREIGDQWGMTFSLTYLGTVAKALGDYQEAKQLFQESIAIGESIGDQRGRATGLNNIGDAVAALGEYSEAKQLYNESLTIFKEIGSQLGIITSLTNLGNVSCALGEYQAAWRLFQSALKLALANRVMPKVLDVFAGVAELWLKEEKTQRALEILALIVNHHASSKENQDRAVRLLSDLMPQLSAEMMSLTEQIEQDKLVEEIIKEIIP